jgi:hypothetical protein
MSAMQSETSTIAGHWLATSLRVRRSTPVTGAALAPNHRGSVQMNNETLISRGSDNSATRISAVGEQRQIDRAFEGTRSRAIPISDSAEVSLCASA